MVRFGIKRRPMSLTHPQKDYIKKHLKDKSITEIAGNLKISQEEILTYLKKRWDKEKYEKFLKKEDIKNETTFSFFKQSISDSFKKGKENEVIPTTGNLFSKGLGVFFKNNWTFFLLLAFLVFVSYVNILDNDFLSDDIPTIVQNPALKDPGLIWAFLPGMVRPFIYWFAQAVGGINPFAFHFFNNFLFHLGTTWMVFVAITLIYNKRVAILAASLFAVHPAIAEAVTWVSAGGYTQYAFFFLLSFVFYLLSKNNNKYYLLSLFAYFISLEAHTSALVLSGIYFLYELSFGNLKSNFKKLIPFFALSFVWVWIAYAGLGERVNTLQTVNYQKGGVDNPLVQLPVAITSYIILFLFPKDLTLYHSELAFPIPLFVLSWVILLSLLGAIIYGFFKNKSLFFWLLFPIVTLLPTLTPFRLTWIVAERYIYLGSLGIFVLVAILFSKLISQEKTKTIGFIVFSLAILIFSIRTIVRNEDWQNQDRLWVVTGKTSPSSPNTHNNLGDVYGRNGDKEKAAQEFKKAIEIKPDYADAYHNLANTYQEMGKTSEAMENYQKAAYYNPNLWQSYQNIAAIYFGQGKYQESISYIQKALQINSKNLNLVTSLGIVYLKMGDKDNAGKVFNYILSLDPNNQIAKQGLEELSK